MRATPDLSTARWRKSSYSGGQEGDECLEVADGFSAPVPVRDSKAPLGSVLLFSPQAWDAFITAVKDGPVRAV
ncbi:DUF397 domain-containing protein [Streptomyces sp. NPDC014805]|uniref:DUF397 domain-containing protein n=1 Tax=Streptomyces sp. NPDC014805 TaxID=3364919 RepID=UPI0036FF1FC0